jgi:hypothetical protein
MKYIIAEPLAPLAAPNLLDPLEKKAMATHHAIVDAARCGPPRLNLAPFRYSPYPRGLPHALNILNMATPEEQGML